MNACNFADPVGTSGSNSIADLFDENNTHTHSIDYNKKAKRKRDVAPTPAPVPAPTLLPPLPPFYGQPRWETLPKEKFKPRWGNLPKEKEKSTSKLNQIESELNQNKIISLLVDVSLKLDKLDENKRKPKSANDKQEDFTGDDEGMDGWYNEFENLSVDT
jgi:hypothetical protein